MNRGKDFDCAMTDIEDGVVRNFHFEGVSAISLGSICLSVSFLFSSSFCLSFASTHLKLLLFVPLFIKSLTYPIAFPSFFGLRTQLLLQP